MFRLFVTVNTGTQFKMYHRPCFMFQILAYRRPSFDNDTHANTVNTVTVKRNSPPKIGQSLPRDNVLCVHVNELVQWLLSGVVMWEVG